ncbi:FxSxx-COOH system tetratricopeptide repeat protein [Dactylosporangium siamense]|uniref:ATP-binding protein n=1 Tax=Dactylosporangium siamense TaxID=685454 RepID=A0A919UE25_9ACTN|nr:ATP-binding protein [Dactylosporangium siamense]
MLFAGLALSVWWWPSGWPVPRFGWKGTEQANVVAGIVSGVLSLVSTVASIVALRPRPEPAPGTQRAGGLIQVGRVPQPAAWLQDRSSRIDLARAARAGRTAVLTQVLSGMGGVGKTQLAAQFARNLVTDGELDVLVWVTASSPDAIIAGYAEIARELRLTDADTPPRAAADRLLGWLERTDQRWLIVLDNLDIPGHATGLWPPANAAGRTVVTTRRRDAVLHTDGRSLVDVGLFTPGEAATYLSHAISNPTDSDQIRSLASDLGHLPIAVAQAAAFIRDRSIDVAEYRRWLSSRRQQLTDLLPPSDALPDDHQSTVAATWSLSIDAANTTPPRGVARPLLELLSLLDPNGIPTALFTTDPICAHLTATAGGQAVDGQNALDAIHSLHRLNLITHDAQSGGIRVHALVQRTTRDHLAPTQLTTAAHAAADALAAIWPSIERNPAHGQTLRANAAALRHHTSDTLFASGIHLVLFVTGRSFGEAGLVAAAVDYFQDLCLTAQHRLGPDHPDTLTTRGNLARWRDRAGDPAGAGTALAQLLDDYLRVLGPDHPDTLLTRRHLAYSRGRAGDPIGAGTALAQLLEDHVRVLGPDHPDTLLTRSNLAHSRGQAGDPIGAGTALAQLLEDHVRVLGQDHPHTLTTRSHLAHSRGQAGDLAGAATDLVQLLDDYLRVLGPDHPDTLLTRSHLARWRGQAGDPAGAATELAQLLEDRLRVLGPDHPHTLTTRSHLARWRGQAGDSAGAGIALVQLLEDRLRVLGPDHPDTLLTRSHLARWRGQAGDPAGAATDLVQLLEDRLRVLGPDHPHTLTTRSHLAHWRGQAGDPAAAATALVQLLDDYLRVLGPDHPDTLTTRNHLAHWQREPRRNQFP